MQATYYGQSCFMVEIDGTKLLFDPFITGNPKTKDIVDVKSLKPDFILVSHGHGDHIGDTVEIAKNTGATVISLYEITTWLEKQGVSRVNGLNLGGHAELPGIKVQMVPAWHSSTLPDGTPGGTAAGFIVTHQKGAFYFSGDTALFQEMKLFSRRNKLDFAFLCLGDHYTMGIEDAAIAAEFLGTNKVIGMHFDTFPPIEIDHAQAHDVFKKAHINLTLPKIGDVITL